LNKLQTLFKTCAVLNDWRSVSFHKTHKQSTSLNERRSLTELRVICKTATVGETNWLEPVIKHQNNSNKKGGTRRPTTKTEIRKLSGSAVYCSLNIRTI